MGLDNADEGMGRNRQECGINGIGCDNGTAGMD